MKRWRITICWGGAAFYISAACCITGCYDFAGAHREIKENEAIRQQLEREIEREAALKKQLEELNKLNGSTNRALCPN